MRAQGGVLLDYVKEHWLQYLIGATVAALLGLGLSFYLGEKWSTPESVRAQRVEQEQAQEDELNQDEEEINDLSDINDAG